MRLAKFSLVGLIGIVVQLATLSILTRSGMNYLFATVCAVEAAVLQNFCWHQRFTWIDRPSTTVWVRLARFHLSNASISLVGNVALMRLLVGALRLTPVLANVIAIGLCSLFNYLASDRWVFTTTESVKAEDQFIGRDLSGPASAPECAERTEHRSAQPWQQAPAPSRSDV